MRAEVRVRVRVRVIRVRVKVRGWTRVCAEVLPHDTCGARIAALPLANYHRPALEARL